MAKKRQAKRQPAKRKQRGGNGGNVQHHPIRKFFKWVGIVILAAFLFGVALFAYYAKDAPEITQSDLQKDGSSTIYAMNNKQITQLGLENREYITAQKIPQQLKDAVVSVEDSHFYNEPFGINPIRIVTATISNVLHRGGLQGASTLTQQVVKLSVFSTKASDQTLKRKAQEAVLAFKVEQKYSKEQILEFYINKVYMNFGQYGMQTGAKYYYGKSLSKLTLAQTAFIAGLGQSPVGYNPYTHPEAATKRRDTVINAMLKNKKITATQAAEAKATPITSGLVKQKTAKNNADEAKVTDSYLTSVIKEVKKRTGLNPYTAGMKIYTNLDLSAQKRLYKIVNSDKYVQFPGDTFQTAVTMTNPETGQVTAQIGGRKTGDVQRSLNRATQTSRSNGSTMKPMMDYAPAIEYLSANTGLTIADEKYYYPDSDVELHDWDNKYMGDISMRTALKLSRNIPAIKMLAATGLSRANSFVKGLGLKLTKAERTAYSSGIGAGVSTEQEAAAYGAFANGGQYYKPYYVRKITTADGVSTSYSSSPTRAMKSSTAYMITDMLKDVMLSGTGTSAKSGNLYEAGKTGSVNYGDAEIKKNPSLKGLNKDEWFTGYTRKNVISVWTGYDKPLENGLGAVSQKIALLIYRNLMSYVSENETNEDWVMPSTVIAKQVNGQRELFVKGSAAANIADDSSSSSSDSSSDSSSESSESSSNSESSAADNSSDYSSSLSSDDNADEQSTASSKSTSTSSESASTHSAASSSARQ
ncbi:transglycosylase domain-containing protein [Lacticaseibacillus sharpeae]|uniref:Penicillin-binding protein 1A n=1 Tax=Lacticaseibacillus sharpeae JCM 1186 = DSM 20505 TaxID=1291052 RepID=A0A0R1ZW52_9LACO|nr:penicillin-binding protein 1A [Lacticaseibacillus sharpeae JCM 1186 = DSM 20505]